MIRAATPRTPANQLLVLDIGNSATHLGIWSRGDLRATQQVPAAAEHTLGAVIQEFWNAMDAEFRAVVACSVVPARLEMIRAAVEQTTGQALQVIGEHLPAPVNAAIDSPQTVGMDRLCCAGAAHHIEGAACTVVDAGTAITVDCISGDGRFLGGAILPGLELQAEALARGTAGLPHVQPALPSSPLGQDTTHAICSGITFGAAGAIKELTERYASMLGHWPILILTGGSAELLAGALDIVDKVVPHLCLRGAVLAYERSF